MWNVVKIIKLERVILLLLAHSLLFLCLCGFKLVRVLCLSEVVHLCAVIPLLFLHYFCDDVSGLVFH